MKRLSIFIGLLFFYLYFPSFIYAVTLNILDYPTEIKNNDDTFKIKVEIIGAKEGTNYLRIQFFKESTHNYFGETNNNEEYYGGSDGLKYVPVIISSESATLINIDGRIGHPNSTDYPDKGTYKLRIQRYTASGTSASDTQEAKNVQINIDLPSPTPSPIPTPKLTPTPISSSTSIKSPSPIASTVNKIKPSPTNLSKIEAISVGDILGQTASNSDEIMEASTSSPVAENSGKNNYTGWIFFTAGLFIASSAGLFAYQRVKDREQLI